MNVRKGFCEVATVTSFTQPSNDILKRSRQADKYHAHNSLVQPAEYL